MALLPGTPVVYGDGLKGVVARAVGDDGVQLRDDKDTVLSLSEVVRRGVGPPGTRARLREDGLEGVVLGYRAEDNLTALLIGSAIREVDSSELEVVVDDDSDSGDSVASLASPVVDCVARAATTAVQAVKQVGPLDFRGAASAVRRSKAGQAATRVAAETFEETMRATKKDGAVATLVDAARRLKEKTDDADLATKITARLSDAAVVRRVFAKVLPTTKTTTTTRGGPPGEEEEGQEEEEDNLAATLSKATVEFATSCLEGSDAALESARPALQRAVETALRAAPPETLLELRLASDYYDGALAGALLRQSGAETILRFLSSSQNEGDENDDDDDQKKMGGGTAAFAKYVEGLLRRKSSSSTTEDGALSFESTLEKALDDESAVETVKRASELTSKLASAVKIVDADERAKHFVSKLFDEDLERFVGAIADLDVDDAASKLEAVVDGDARDRADLVDRANDAALDFLLRHLPAMPVPPVDVDKDGVSYSVKNLNLSKFKLAKRDVRVDVPLVVSSSTTQQDHSVGGGNGASSFFGDPRLDDDDDDDDDEATAREVAAVAAAGVVPPSSSSSSVPWSSTRCVSIKARRMSAKFEDLEWKFKQSYFPYLEGSGRADVDVDDAALLIEIAARRDAETGKPVLGLTRCQVEIAHLDLRLADKDSRLAWALNTLSQIFAAQVRDYVRDSLESFVADYVVSMLASADDVLPTAWPALARVFKQLPSDGGQLPVLPELDLMATTTKAGVSAVSSASSAAASAAEESSPAAPLPLSEDTEKDLLQRRRKEALLASQRRRRRKRAGASSSSSKQQASVVHVALREPGPLGLDLAVAALENGQEVLTVTGVRGQTAQALRDRRLKLEKGAVLVQVDDRETSDFDRVADVVKAVTAPDRPKRLAFLEASSSSSSRGALAATTQKKKKKAKGLSVDSVEIFPKSAPGREAGSLGVKLRRHDALDEAVEIADASSASGALRVGAIVVACTGAPRLVSPRGERASPARVGAVVTACVARAADAGDAFSLAVAASPDRAFRLSSKDLVFQQIEPHFILVGLAPSPSPLALAGGSLNDVVVRVAGVDLPTPDGYAADVAKIKDAVQRGDPFDLVLRRGRRGDLFTVTLGNLGEEKLGVTFCRCHDTDLPKIKRFDGVPGPVARSAAWQTKDLRPGLALVAVDDLPLLRRTHTTLADLEALLQKEGPRTLIFRDVEAYEDMLYRFGQASPE